MDLTDDLRKQDEQAAAQFAETVKETQERVRLILKKLRGLERDAEELRASVEPGCDLEDLSGRVNALELKVDGLWMDIYAAVASALGWRHSPAEVASWYQRSCDEGYNHPRVGPSDINDVMYERKVPNAPLRARLGASGLTLDGLCALLDRPPTDRTWLARQLGLAPTSSRGGKSLSVFMAYDTAVGIARALGMTPIQAGV